VNPTQFKKKKALSLLVVVGLGLSAVAASCAQGKVDAYAKPDEVVCIYDHKTGVLKQEMPPASKLTSVNDTDEQNIVPASNRFWNFTKTPSKDSASAGFVENLDATQKKVQAQGEIDFMFFQPKACEWNTVFGRRSFKDGYQGMAYNIEGDPNTPWQVWLKRNFEDLLTRVSKSIFNQYTWKQMKYNWPVNANPETGELPSGQEPGVLVLTEIEGKLSEAFSKAQTSTLTAQYFCGWGYTQAKPNDCPPIQVHLTGVDVVDQAPAQAFEKLQAEKEANANATAQAVLDQQGKDAAVSSETARLAKEKEIKDLQNKADVEEEVRKQALLKAQKATADLAAQQQANNDLAVCAQAAGLNGGKISPQECATILLALKGLSPSVPGGTVNIGK
jgi:hypothetical protein